MKPAKPKRSKREKPSRVPATTQETGQKPPGGRRPPVNEDQRPPA